MDYNVYPSLIDIPGDIYHLIATHLDTYSVICVLITCARIRYSPDMIKIIAVRKKIHRRTQARVQNKDVIRLIYHSCSLPFPRVRHEFVEDHIAVINIKCMRTAVDQLYEIRNKQYRVDKFDINRTRAVNRRDRLDYIRDHNGAHYQQAPESMSEPIAFTLLTLNRHMRYIEKSKK